MTEIKVPNLNGNYVESTNIVVNPTYGERFDLKISKTGRVVNLFGRFDISTEVPTYTQLITLPDGFYKNVISIFIYKFGSLNSFYWCSAREVITTQNTVVPNGIYYVNATWVI